MEHCQRCSAGQRSAELHSEPEADRSLAASSSAPSPAAQSPPRARRKVFSWAELLRRVFAIDVLVCGRCGGSMQLVACLSDPNVVAKILAHLGLPTSPPPLSPARWPEQLGLLIDCDQTGTADSADCPDAASVTPQRPTLPCTAIGRRWGPGGGAGRADRHRRLGHLRATAPSVA